MPGQFLANLRGREVLLNPELSRRRVVSLPSCRVTNGLIGGGREVSGECVGWLVGLVGELLHRLGALFLVPHVGVVVAMRAGFL